MEPKPKRHLSRRVRPGARRPCRLPPARATRNRSDPHDTHPPHGPARRGLRACPSCRSAGRDGCAAQGSGTCLPMQRCGDAGSARICQTPCMAVPGHSGSKVDPRDQVPRPDRSGRPKGDTGGMDEGPVGGAGRQGDATAKRPAGPAAQRRARGGFARIAPKTREQRVQREASVKRVGALPRHHAFDRASLVGHGPDGATLGRDSRDVADKVPARAAAAVKPDGMAAKGWHGRSRPGVRVRRWSAPKSAQARRGCRRISRNAGGGSATGRIDRGSQSGNKFRCLKKYTDTPRTGAGV